MTMTKITFTNYTHHLYDGAQLLVNGRIITARKDGAWNSGYEVGGRSLFNLLEEHDVFLANV